MNATQAPFTLLCDCGDLIPMPEGFADDTALTLWEQHGHWPDLVIVLCPCGAELRIGPEANGGDPAADADATIDFMELHQHCHVQVLDATTLESNPPQEDKTIE